MLRTAARVLVTIAFLLPLTLAREIGERDFSVSDAASKIPSPAGPTAGASAPGHASTQLSKTVAKHPAPARSPARTAARRAAQQRAPFARHSRSTRRAIRSMQNARVMRLEGFPSSVAGVFHDSYRLYKHGLPVFNRTGRLHRRDDRVFAQTGKLGIPPLAVEPASISAREAIDRALATVPGRGQRAPARSERGWLATSNGTLPIWQTTLAIADPLATWLVRVDARDGAVLSSHNLIRTATGSGSVYAENAVTSPVPEATPLLDLDGSGFLQGRVTRVFDVRQIEAYRPDLFFDFAESDSRFVQTSVYRGLTDAARYAEAHGLSLLNEHVLAFTNLSMGANGEEFNNAFYDPFFPIFGFGNGDGTLTANLGTDIDVAIHEMGHHLFAELVDPTGSSSLASAAAINEGFADSLAAFVNDDPEIGESILPGRPFLRSVANSAVWPQDSNRDPHLEGLIYSGLNWDLRNSFGNDEAARIVIAGLPFLDPEDDFLPQAYREALLQGAQLVAPGAATHTSIQALADARGLIARHELGVQGYLDEESSVGSSLLEGEFQVYLFSEFPSSRQITLEMTGTGDADLYVAPNSFFDPQDPSTYLASVSPNSTSEVVNVTASSLPSVDDDDGWIVIVQDVPDDGRSSSFELTVRSVLPLPAISVGGSYFGSIAEGGDFDFITFAGNADQIVRLEATALTENFDLAVAIFEPTTIEIYAADDDSGEGSNSLIQGARLPATQTYAIAIFSIIADIDPNVGTGAFRLDLSSCSNTGVDFDSDGQADACDDDDDGDTFVDSEDIDPLDPLLCQDIEGDGCDDCVSGDFAPFDDGPNADGDHLCDAGDPDDDNDGCEDGIDAFPFDPSVDEDVDLVGADCDNCPEEFNPGQVDFDGDGLGDICDPTPMPEPGARALPGLSIGLLCLLRAQRSRRRKLDSRERCPARPTRPLACTTTPTERKEPGRAGERNPGIRHHCRGRRCPRSRKPRRGSRGTQQPTTR